MPVFSYMAWDLDSSAAKGTIVADTPRQARDTLRQRGLTITQIAPVHAATGQSFGARYGGRRDRGQVVSFVRDLGTLLQTGIPLLAALRTLSRQHRGRFRAIVEQLVDQVSAGVSLADAMASQDAYFDELAINIVAVGEQTGSLESALDRLADFQEKAQRLRSQITTALIYPAVVAVIGVVVTVFLMTKVVPDLLSTLTEAQKDLPGITMAVKAISDLLRGWWWALLAGIVLITLVLRGVVRSERGRLLVDRAVLRLPVLADLIRKENVSRMSIVMATLLESGLQFTDAVRITKPTLGNRVFRQALSEYESAVMAGRDVAAPLEASGVFNPVVVQTLAVGQASGELEQMLRRLADKYDQQVSTAAQRLTALLEPLLIVALALLVGFIALATILPILEMSNVL